MKAEHRKELETNILADRMGRVIRGNHETPTTAVWYAVIAVCVVCSVAFIGFRWYVTSQEKSADAWGTFERGEQQELFMLAEKFSTQTVGKAARFQIAFEKLWIFGISKLGSNTVEAKHAIEEARNDYQKLADESKSDPPFLGEALYALAVIEETGAIDDPDKLTMAISAYRRVAKEAKDTSYAKLATERADILEVPAAVDNEDPKTREEREAREARLRDIRAVYSYLKADLRPRVPGGGLMPGLQPPPFDRDELMKMIEQRQKERPPVEGKVTEPKSPDGKTDTKTPDKKGDPAKTPETTKLPDIPAPPVNTPAAKAPEATTPDPKTDEKKSEKK